MHQMRVLFVSTDQALQTHAWVGSFATLFVLPFSCPVTSASNQFLHVCSPCFQRGLPQRGNVRGAMQRRVGSGSRFEGRRVHWRMILIEDTNEDTNEDLEES